MNETPTAVLDQTAFQRVWRRVMPQDRPDCPFTLNPSVPAALPASPPLSSAVPGQSVPCLGDASQGELPALEELLTLVSQARQAYRALARRAGRKGLFSSLAAAKDRQVRRLSAAHFLISGQDHVTPIVPVPIPADTALALRERFRGEQREAAQLISSALASADPCLAQLYRELAEEDRDYGDRLRARLEER